MRWVLLMGASITDYVVPGYCPTFWKYMDMSCERRSMSDSVSDKLPLSTFSRDPAHRRLMWGCDAGLGIAASQPRYFSAALRLQLYKELQEPCHVRHSRKAHQRQGCSQC
jgi:hypothetical protein